MAQKTQSREAKKGSKKIFNENLSGKQKELSKD